MFGNGVLDKLPYKFGSEARAQRLKEAIDKQAVPKEVNCFGTDKFKILGRKLTIEIFNEKIQHWQECIAVEYPDICPICGSFMLVRAIQGSTWFALCSKECYEKFDKLREESKQTT